MERIPRRSGLRTITARGVDAEPVNHLVPDGSERVNHQSFAERNPDIVHNNIPEMEILDAKVRSLSD